ncbi:MAG: twin-arginine translocase TatA/TatE family subunit [Bryobacteraceae bacterium]|jgi:sec-independent protein translocase protein TatA
MGPIGVQEMIFIFLLALVLFGPKKLPELGRMLGRAITEFRRAQSELKATFDREMLNLERENESLKEITSGYQYNNYNYDYSSSDAGTYGEPYGSTTTEPHDSNVTNTSTDSASATEGAVSVSPVMPEGVVAHQTTPEGVAPGAADIPENAPVVEHNV